MSRHFLIAGVCTLVACSSAIAISGFWRASYEGEFLSTVAATELARIPEAPAKKDQCFYTWHDELRSYASRWQEFLKGPHSHEKKKLRSYEFMDLLSRAIGESDIPEEVAELGKLLEQHEEINTSLAEPEKIVQMARDAYFSSNINRGIWLLELIVDNPSYHALDVELMIIILLAISDDCDAAAERLQRISDADALGKADTAIFLIALCQLQHMRLDEAVVTLGKLVESHPNSRHRTSAEGLLHRVQRTRRR